MWAKKIVQNICDEFLNEGFIILDSNDNSLNLDDPVPFTGNSFRLMKFLDNDNYVLLKLTTGDTKAKIFVASWHFSSESIRSLNETFHEIPVRKFMADFQYKDFCWTEPSVYSDEKEPPDIENANLEIFSWIKNTYGELKQDMLMIDQCIENNILASYTSLIAHYFLNKNFERVLEIVNKAKQRPYLKIVELDGSIINLTMISEKYFANIISRCKEEMQST